MAYQGFEAVRRGAAVGGARDPDAVAAEAGRRKYGKERFQRAAAAGKKMRGMAPRARALRRRSHMMPDGGME